MKHLIAKCVLLLTLGFNFTAGAVLSSLPVSVPTGVGIVVLATLPVTTGFGQCSKDQLVASAKDVLTVVNDTTLQGFLRTLAPSALTKLLALAPTATDLVKAFQSGDTSSGLALINTIFPVIEEIAAAVATLSPQAMAILGIANIGLHFILNHTKATSAVKAARKAGVAAVRVADDYSTQRAWGCDYRPKDSRCAQLAH